MKLRSYVCGGWHESTADGALLRDATTGAVVAQASTEGVDFRATLDYARRVGGPALRDLTFHQRAPLLANTNSVLMPPSMSIHESAFVAPVA